MPTFHLLEKSVNDATLVSILDRTLLAVTSAALAGSAVTVDLVHVVTLEASLVMTRVVAIRVPVKVTAGTALMVETAVTVVQALNRRRIARTAKRAQTLGLATILLLDRRV